MRYAPIRKNPANQHALTSINLYGCLVGHRSNALWPVALQLDCPRFPRHYRLPLQIDLCALLLRLSPLCRILLHTTQELFPAARVLHVFDPDIDSLLDVAVADLLVADYADCRLCHVVDDTGLAVVDLVWHACANCQSQRCVRPSCGGMWTYPFERHRW